MVAIASHPSPNFGPRRDGLTPTLIVVHYTAMASASAAIDRLCDPDAEVSAHYVIARDGAITQLVQEDMRAWHAGIGTWQGMDDINSRSIGIELDNNGASPFSAPLMNSLETLVRDIMGRWNIPPTGVIGHSDMAPGRKIDPGPRFDWARLERSRLAVRPCASVPETGHDMSDFCALARSAGYTAQSNPEDLLAAVRLRLRPAAKGPLTPADFQALLA